MTNILKNFKEVETELLKSESALFELVNLDEKYMFKLIDINATLIALFTPFLLLSVTVKSSDFPILVEIRPLLFIIVGWLIFWMVSLMLWSYLLHYGLLWFKGKSQRDYASKKADYVKKRFEKEFIKNLKSGGDISLSKIQEELEAYRKLYGRRNLKKYFKKLRKELSISDA